MFKYCMFRCKYKYLFCFVTQKFIKGAWVAAITICNSRLDHANCYKNIIANDVENSYKAFSSAFSSAFGE